MTQLSKEIGSKPQSFLNYINSIQVTGISQCPAINEGFTPSPTEAQNTGEEDRKQSYMAALFGTCYTHSNHEPNASTLAYTHRNKNGPVRSRVLMGRTRGAWVPTIKGMASDRF